MVAKPSYPPCMPDEPELEPIDEGCFRETGFATREIADAWDKELTRRLEQAERGEVRMLSLEEVRHTIHKVLYG